MTPRIIDSFKGKYGFLSNFSPHMVYFEGVLYPTAEHAYAAAKSTDLTDRFAIVMIDAPGKAKRFGRTLTLRPDWEQVKVKVMEEILRYKFAVNPLRQLLLDTGDAWLIEGNYWHDQTWGDCRCNAHVNEPGQNLLGIALMKQRARVGGAGVPERKPPIIEERYGC